MFHTIVCATIRQMHSACFRKNIIDFSDWLLHTHRSHLFKPVQSALVSEAFSISERLPFFHWLHMSDNEQKLHLQLNQRDVLLCFPHITSGSVQPSQVYDICVSARCCRPPPLDCCCQKVNTEIDEWHIFNTFSAFKMLAIWLFQPPIMFL